jgi:hypothetical protein
MNMEWILLVSILIGGQPRQVEIQPLGQFICSIMASSIPKKNIMYNGGDLKIISAECISTKKEEPNPLT